MSNSLRNCVRGKITSITSDRVVSEVILDTASGQIVSIISTSSVVELGLEVGMECAAIFKATNVSIKTCDCGGHGEGDCDCKKG